VTIRIHHLERSRSDRILWLAEELGLQYELVRYERDPKTQRAEAALKKIHPLGKSPAIEDAGQVIVESGAIVGYLVSRYGRGRMSPPQDSPDWGRYLQWLHFAEGSAMAQLVLDLFLSGRFGGAPPSPLAPAVSASSGEMLAWLDAELAQRAYFAGREFSAADIMMTFPIRMAAGFGLTADRPALTDYLAQISQRDAYQRAMKIAEG
jgi:glutathione S-transferase